MLLNWTRHIAASPHLLLQVQRGLFHLVNRGLLHAKADLTPALVGEAGAPMTAHPVAMHSHHEQFLRAAGTSALEDSLISACNNQFRMDLLTPVVKPPSASRRSAPGPFKLMDISGAKTMAQAPAGQQQHAQGGAGSRAAAGAGGGEELPARPYDALLDAFSLHEFMIRKGSTISNTPEFDSYRRTYEHAWHVVSVLIQRLEAVCLQYDLPLVVVDGKSLADLGVAAQDGRMVPQLPDLLSCVKNIQEVSGLLKEPGRRFRGPAGTEAAALQIQAHFRGHLARRRDSKGGRAAGTIQNAWRNMRLRGQVAGGGQRGGGRGGAGAI